MSISIATYVEFPARYHALVAALPGSVLLQTSRFDALNYRSYLFLRPVRTLREGPALFEEIEQALAEGAHVAGFLTYEFGEQMQGLGRSAPQDGLTPLAWFGVYPKVFVFDHRTGKFDSEAPDDVMTEEAPSDPGFEIRNPRFGITRENYAGKVAAIQEYIRAGDTYQVNFTDKLRFNFAGAPQAIFAALAENQPAPYSAFLHDEDWHILSFSPELFFRLANRRMVTRPMKGTARRGADLAEDKAIAQWLHRDPKNRSENLMIVDLLRNDLGRICEYGSVETEQLFAVEKYETLFQMTSGVSGTLRPGTRYADIFASLFPCGSVTGAPKLRTMEIIQGLEAGPRGVYTGAIGFFSPAGEAVFNVPIRTVILHGSQAVMGVGSGIVADSRAEDEYGECLLKSDFLIRHKESFALLESILWDEGYSRLPWHLERMESSAVYFDFPFDRPAILAALRDAERQLHPGAPSKVRLLLERSGAVAITHTRVEVPAGTGTAVVSAIPVSSNDWFLRHKTTRRQLYDQQYEWARRQGYDEVLFVNERGELTEGAISNVFLEIAGRWFTPPGTCGLLPGIFRRHVLETNPTAQERTLSLADLASADAVYICNAVRGCRRVTVAPGVNTAIADQP